MSTFLFLFTRKEKRKVAKEKEKRKGIGNDLSLFCMKKDAATFKTEVTDNGEYSELLHLIISYHKLPLLSKQ